MLEKIICHGDGGFDYTVTEKLREKLRQAGYFEEAKSAEFCVLDLNDDGEPELYVGVEEKNLYSCHMISGHITLENTGITEKERYSGGVYRVSYLKDGKVIHEFTYPLHVRRGGVAW